LRRSILLVATAMLMIAALALTAGPALAEGHFCRWYQWDPYYQGYWMWNACGSAWSWVGEIPWVDLEPWRPGGPQLL
jgi:hypothetical protein